jgi:polyphenol oxidase
MSEHWLRPQWPAPVNVHALMTTRAGGVSAGEYASMNVGKSSGDALENVMRNREILAAHAGRPIRWLHQVHGNRVVDDAGYVEGVQADGQITRGVDCALAVMAADCMPVLFAAHDGSVVGAAHAGWRGLAAGVLENTITAMNIPAAQIVAWMGPCIGPSAFEVGEEVRAAFCDADASATPGFVARDGVPGKYWCDLNWLAKQRICAAGIEAIYGGEGCTFTEPDRFFSYRRVAQSGRMAALIWKD